MGSGYEDSFENELCVFLLFVEMTKQLTGRTTMTTSGFEALFPVLTLLPERCHRRQSLVPEA